MLAQCWLPLAGCCLLLTERDGHYPSEAATVILQVEVVLLGRENDWCVLAIDFDGEVGLITCERSGVGQGTRQSLPLRRRVGGKSGFGRSLGHQCPRRTW